VVLVAVVVLVVVVVVVLVLVVVVVCVCRCTISPITLGVVNGSTLYTGTEGVEVSGNMGLLLTHTSG